MQCYVLEIHTVIHLPLIINVLITFWEIYAMAAFNSSCGGAAKLISIEFHMEIWLPTLMLLLVLLFVYKYPRTWHGVLVGSQHCAHPIDVFYKRRAKELQFYQWINPICWINPITDNDIESFRLDIIH